MIINLLNDDVKDIIYKFKRLFVQVFAEHNSNHKTNHF